jgi:hypothetical protein
MPACLRVPVFTHLAVQVRLREHSSGIYEHHQSVEQYPGQCPPAGLELEPMEYKNPGRLQPMLWPMDGSVPTSFAIHELPGCQ